MNPSELGKSCQVKRGCFRRLAMKQMRLLLAERCQHCDCVNLCRPTFNCRHHHLNLARSVNCEDVCSGFGNCFRPELDGVWNVVELGVNPDATSTRISEPFYDTWAMLVERIVNLDGMN